MIELATLHAVSYIMGSLGVFVAAVYYIVNIQNNRNNQRETLETRQVQLYMQIYNQGVNNRNFIEAWNRVQHLKLNNLQEFLDATNYENPETRENLYAINVLTGYYEGIGTLVKENMLSIRWVALLFGSWTRMFWEKIEPVAEELRVYRKAPRIFSETEYLYNELMKYMKEHPEIAT
jgi:hypothetical protein